MTKSIVLFGGAFNPPSLAHLSLAEQIINEWDVDKLLFLPVGDAYQKPGLLPSHHRLNMLKESIKGVTAFDISTIEIEADVCLTTIDSLRIVESQYPDHDIWYVMGADNLADLPNWNDYDLIVAQYKLLVIERGNVSVAEIIQSDEILTTFKENILSLTEEVQSTCSSTIIRNRIKDKKNYKYLVPHGVEGYIQVFHLYES